METIFGARYAFSLCTRIGFVAILISENHHISINVDSIVQNLLSLPLVCFYFQGFL